MKKIFIITSVIYFKDKPLSYTDNRSAFSPEQRAEQTIKTIESIREKMPDAKIIFLESGLKEKLPLDLDKLADEYIYLGKNPIIRWACDGKYKGLGEALTLLLSQKYFKNKADFYFKISGRYFLTENFNFDEWDKESFNARKYEYNISTRLYGFPNIFFKTWISTLRQSLFSLMRNKSIEDCLTEKISTADINYLSILGVSGNVAPNGGFLSE